MDRDHQNRLLGNRDGLVTALLAVRQQIGAVQYRYQHVSPRHTRKLAKRDYMLTMLREIEAVIERKRVEIVQAYSHQKELAEVVRHGPGSS